MRVDYFQTFVRLRSKTTRDWFAHPELRARLVADAEAGASNVNDVVVGVLAAHYGVEAELSGRRKRAALLGEELNLRIPLRLYGVLAASAARYPRTVQREVLAVLSSHYGLQLPRRRRGLRRARRAAA